MQTNVVQSTVGDVEDGVAVVASSAATVDAPSVDRQSVINVIVRLGEELMLVSSPLSILRSLKACCDDVIAGGALNVAQMIECLDYTVESVADSPPQLAMTLRVLSNHYAESLSADDVTISGTIANSNDDSTSTS